MQYGSFALLLPVMSSKKTNGLCLAAYSPELDSGQTVPAMFSW